MKKPKAITHYTHRAERPAEAPDTKPGNYYVSAMDGPTHWLLLGPFADDHAKALSMVEPVRNLANARHPKSAFYAFGTLRMEPGHTKPGSANGDFPEALAA